MAKTISAKSVVEQRLDERPELTSKFGDNALPLLGLSLYVQAEDIDSLADESLTDGGDDKKIDFCFIDRTTNYAAVVQGYRSKTWGKQAAEANKATDLISAAGWLFTGDLNKVPDKLREVAIELRDAIAGGELNRIEFLYIHNCHESSNVQNELKTAASTAAKLIGNESICVAAQELGLETLDDLCRAAENEIFVQEQITIPSENVIVEKGKVWQAIVASMSGDWLHDLNSKHGSRLFRANYREFLGIRNSVRNINNGIRTSVQKDPDNFWTYNNGVTALVRQITKKRKGYSIDGISVINGAQTTGSIGECSRLEASALKVICRFVTCSDQEVLHRLIKFNNTQNAFRSSDQRSTDTVQQRLKTDLEHLGISYFPRRSGITLPAASITAEAIGPLLCAFHGDPQTAARRRNDIFDIEETYARVFPKSCRGEHIFLVSTLGSAIGEVKLDHKSRVSAGNATNSQLRNYEVLKPSTSKLYLLAIIGAVADEIVGVGLPDQYTWKFSEKAMKKPPAKLILYWKEVVESILPLVAGLIAENAYAETRDFGKIPKIAKQVSSLISAAGNIVSDRFSHIRDETIW